MRAFHSNRLEVLAERLVRLLRESPVSDPFEVERIVVPDRTIERWLRLEIARGTGIAANLEFELPAEFAWSMMRRAIPDLPLDHLYAPNRLRWRLYDLLLDFDDPSDDIPNAWRDGSDPKRTFDLADSLAKVYDRCLLYRPDRVREWEDTKPAPDREYCWQIRLWQRLIQDDPKALHWVNVISAFRQALRSRSVPAVPGACWPKRAFFFGVSSFTPSYLEFLETLKEADRKRAFDLNLFILSPSSQYWSAIRTPREVNRRHGIDIESPEEHFDIGNELVAAWARAGRSSFDRLVGENEEEIDCYEAGEKSSRLAEVQRDILELVPAAEGACALKRDFDEDDDSLQIHVCHSAIREAEVLHDRLLDIMQRDHSISLADILILTPDTATHGPAIKAVFESEGTISVRIARARQGDSSTIRAFVDLLSLPTSRYEAQRALAPLDSAAVRARFGIEEASLPAIRQWIRDAGIRWGIDADHRAAEGLPQGPQNSWRAGLRRLLIGYAVTDDDDSVCDLVPCPIRGVGGLDPGTGDYEQLGGFVSYCEAIFALRTLSDRGRKRSAKQWGEELHGIVDRFFRTPAHGSQSGFDILDDIEGIRGLIEKFLKEAAPHPSPEDAMPIDFAVVRDVFEKMADGSSMESVRLAEAATVMGLAQGRIFPAKVVCVVGMNDGVFPRNPSIPTFDLVAANPEEGDQDLRLEDRFAFLEALLAARDCFIVSYTGRNLRNDEAIPPSILVGEWIDYLKKRFPDAGDLEGRMLYRHPLQPFNPRYFKPRDPEHCDKEHRTPLFSYSKEMCEAAKALEGDPRKDASFDRRLQCALSDDPGIEPVAQAFDIKKSDADSGSVMLDDLIDFFTNPTRYFLDKSLRIRLRRPEVGLENEEMFSLDPLSRYGVRRALFRHRKKERGIEHSLTILQGKGEIPHGVFGQVDLERQRTMIASLEKELEPHRALLDAAPKTIDIKVNGFRLFGTIGDDRSNYLTGNADSQRMVFWRIGSLRAKDRFEAYLRQLAWSIFEGRACPAAIVHYDHKSGKWKTETIAAPNEPKKTLLSWLDAWQQGQTRPLAFFPETSTTFAMTSVRAKKDPWKAATATWKDSAFSEMGGEESDPYFSLVFANIERFAADDVPEDFAPNTQALLFPLIDASETG
ncbi:exodeoxyribonuclease V subunit gamma [Thioalkalivibrio sp. HK1]|uniref:exodeoxyribonuclease V subunit gamma n=1 Tax=Thioalkalivibrio sp. HK1 TaxID=1469245 RepID=UPI00046FF904|nr:exodeoxyribonuclease V subunit gamma [Thioalkalivibrio sp. HK1]